MCLPVLVTIAIGAAIGAATAAATGGDPLTGAIMGGISGGVGGAAAGSLGSMAFSTLSGVAMNMLTPQTPDYSQYGQGAQPYETSSQHTQVTGSGGRQAATVLASEIRQVKQTKALRERQAKASEDYGVELGVEETGLKIA
tara:strand:+ start:193 stop:615 length:423 start_codon:yes stop_codon:yes gene_type:complete